MNRVRKAFTLVEILIVVIILGILAAIVVPQFTSASEEAQLSNAQSQLQTIRNMIELYRVRNNGDYPTCFAAGNWGDAAGATAEARGLLGGDYLRSAPVNPRTGSSTVAAGGEAEAQNVAATDGWYWEVDATTGVGTLRAARLAELGVDSNVAAGNAAPMDATHWVD